MHLSDNTVEIADDEIDLAELFAALWSQWFLIGVTTFLAAAAAVYYAVAIAEPVFEARAKFAFEEKSGGLSGLGDLGGLAALAGVSAGGGGGPSATLEDRIKSRDFILSIADEAGLFDDEEFNPPFGKLSLRGEIQVALGVSERRTYSPAAEIAQIVEKFNEQVVVSVGDGGLVSITTSHSDPERAAIITNTIVERALADILTDQKAKSRAQIDYLAGELLQVQSELESAADAIAEYAVKNDLASDQELARASAQLVLLRDQRETISELRAAFDALEAIRSDSPVFSTTTRNRLIDDHPIVRSNDFRRLIGWQSNPSTWEVPAEEQIEDARANLDVRFLEVNRTIDEFEQLARRNANAASELATLEREATVQKTIYEVMVRQFETQRITEGFQAAIADIYEMAVPPITPTSPKKPLIAALGLVLGLFIGSGVALIITMRRGVLYTRRAVSEAMSSDIAASGVSRYFGRLVARVGRLSAKFSRRPHPQLEEISVEIAQSLPKRILVTPTSSAPLAGGVGLYLASALPDGGAAVVDLTGSLNVSGITPSSSKGLLDKFEAGDGVTIFKAQRKARLNPLSIEQTISEIEDSFERVIVVCPRVGEGAPVTAALAPRAQWIVSVVRAGRTTRAQADRLKSLLKRAPSARATLICE